ncbi:PIG-L family deacetylase [Rothia sp. ZJ932]|uniref:PIG-L family deacetylase n=1 Tax=Rothia sp. ZJ932 TaxID=2810516 RepID=UPI001F07AE44|nr:PIG-L family deacetylase [Rothia sp. ZJ932]
MKTTPLGENTEVPYYPEQGTQVSDDAVYSLLPEGLNSEDARVLFVHAHPDDESTSTGATMGHLAAAGAQVSLLTATRGEMGEVIPEDLKHLEAWHPGTTDRGVGLGRVREQELTEALEVLGVKHHEYLGQGSAHVEGAPELYRDSGMAWGADGRATANPDAADDCLTKLSAEAQAQAVAQHIRTLEPQVVVTYDNGGGYGHPDHVRTHEVVVRAFELLGADAPALLWGLEGDFDAQDARVQAVIRGDHSRKREAMRAHVTQVIIISDDIFEFSNRVPQKISATETYRLLAGKG